MREITNDDLWSAIRGIGMYGMTKAELLTLMHQHSVAFKRDGMFASAVIAKAAQQVAATKREG